MNCYKKLLERVFPEDAASYTCKGRNAMGWGLSSTAFSVFVKGERALPGFFILVHLIKPVILPHLSATYLHTTATITDQTFRGQRWCNQHMFCCGISNSDNFLDQILPQRKFRPRLAALASTQDTPILVLWVQWVLCKKKMLLLSNKKHTGKGEPLWIELLQSLPSKKVHKQSH